MHLPLSSTTFPVWPAQASRSGVESSRSISRDACRPSASDPLQRLLGLGLSAAQVAGMQVTVVGADGGIEAQSGVARAWEQVRKSFACSRPEVEPAEQLRAKVCARAVDEFQSRSGKVLVRASDHEAASRQRLAALMLLRPPMHGACAQALCRAEAWSTEQVFGRSPVGLANLLLGIASDVLQRQRLEAALQGRGPQVRVDAVDEFCDYLADCIERIGDFRDHTGRRPDPLGPELRTEIAAFDQRCRAALARQLLGRRLLGTPGQ